MDARIWGPHAWFFLHSVTFSYPDNPSEKDKRDLYNFFQSVSNILPCTICKNHFRENLEKYPIENFLYNREALVNWLIDIHNIVNRKLGKPMVDNKEIIDRYNNLYKKKYICLIGDKNRDFYKNILLAFFGLLNIIFIIFFWIKSRN